jgi:2'-hydroxyisoflavone reductase
MGDFLESCVRVADNGTELTWVPTDFLATHELEPWQELQMWADNDRPVTGSLTWSSAKALRAGLKIRPIDETVRDTVEWYKSLPAERQAAMRSGIDAAKEAAVLKAWHESQA